MTRLTALDLPSLQRATIGFDRLFEQLDREFANTKSQGYPPYNIVQLNDDEFVISIAVAGFSMENLDITKDGNILRIEGVSSKSDVQIKYLHKGIGERNFRREFTLADHMVVDRAELEFGMLNIYLKRIVPEELQPKKIAISNLNLS